jgi:hypothetical protein
MLANTVVEKQTKERMGGTATDVVLSFFQEPKNCLFARLGKNAHEDSAAIENVCDRINYLLGLRMPSHVS